MDKKERIRLAAEILNEYDSLIRRLICRHTYDENDIDDIYQNVFLSLVATPPTSLTSLPAYLRVVVKNHITDAGRRAASYNNCIDRYARLRLCQTAEDRPETGLMRSELAQTLTALVRASLPSRLADVVLERYIHGRDITEVATRFGLKRRTVSRYCCIASERIRQVVEEGRVESKTLA